MDSLRLENMELSRRLRQLSSQSSYEEVFRTYEGDIKKAQSELATLIEKKTAESAAQGSQPAPASSQPKKGVLH